MSSSLAPIRFGAHIPNQKIVDSAKSGKRTVAFEFESKNAADGAVLSRLLKQPVAKDDTVVVRGQARGGRTSTPEFSFQLGIAGQEVLITPEQGFQLLAGISQNMTMASPRVATRALISLGALLKQASEAQIRSDATLALPKLEEIVPTVLSDTATLLERFPSQNGNRATATVLKTASADVTADPYKLRPHLPFARQIGGSLMQGAKDLARMVDRETSGLSDEQATEALAQAGRAYATSFELLGLPSEI